MSTGTTSGVGCLRSFFAADRRWLDDLLFSRSIDAATSAEIVCILSYQYLATLEVPGELREHTGAGREKNAVGARFDTAELATIRPKRQVQAGQ